MCQNGERRAWRRCASLHIRDLSLMQTLTTKTTPPLADRRPPIGNLLAHARRSRAARAYTPIDLPIEPRRRCARARARAYRVPACRRARPQRGQKTARRRRRGAAAATAATAAARRQRRRPPRLSALLAAATRQRRRRALARCRGFEIVYVVSVVDDARKPISPQGRPRRLAPFAKGALALAWVAAAAAAAAATAATAATAAAHARVAFLFVAILLNKRVFAMLPVGQICDARALLLFSFFLL